MPIQVAGTARKRIYNAYRSTTSGNPYREKVMPLAGQIRQYRQRWRRFLPTDHSIRILDVGCGSGEFLLFLQQEGFHNCSGVDLSQEQIDLARQRGLSNVHVADALEYVSKDRVGYRVVNLQNILEHLTREELFEWMDGVVTALEPGGLVYGVVPNSKSLLSARVRYADITHETSFTPESLRQLFVAVGLRPIAILEHGPLVHNFVSALRFVVWQLVRFSIWIALVAEGADHRDRVYTQNMMFVAEKPTVS